MGRVITSPGVLKNVQGQIDHVTDLYQDIKDNNLKPMSITIDSVTNANGSYSHVTENDRITEDMKAIAIEVGTPEVFFAPIQVTTGNGTITLNCADAHGTSTVTVTFVHTMPIDGGEDVPASVTSTEFDILADRIGVLSNLETTDKSDVVSAVNEVKQTLSDKVGNVPSSATLSVGTHADLETALNTVLSNMSANSSQIIKIITTASFDEFANDSTYLGYLFKGNSNTYAHGSVGGVGRQAEITLSKNNTTWTFSNQIGNLIKTKTVEGVTSSTGNISLDLSAAYYMVIGVRLNSANAGIAEPWNQSSVWWARVINYDGTVKADATISMLVAYIAV